MRKNLTILAALICLACLGYLAQTRRAISQARQEHAVLEKQNKEARQLTEQNESIAQLREQLAGADALKKENAELPKLRNEARQLRRKTEDLEKLKSENERLLAASKQTGNAKASAPMPEGFISRAALVDAGLSTPEATVQTFFWAVTHENAERAMQCLPLPPGYNPTASEKEGLRQQARDQFSRFPGFAIAEKKVINDNEVELQLQSSPGGAPLKMSLERVGAEWKMKQGF